MFLISMVFTVLEGVEQKDQWHEDMDYDMPPIQGDVRGFDYDSQQWMYYEPMKPLIGPEPKQDNTVGGYSKREMDMIQDYIDSYHEEIIDEYGY